MLGRVLRVLPGEDEVAMVADIRIRKGVIRQAIKHEDDSLTRGVCWSTSAPDVCAWTTDSEPGTRSPGDGKKRGAPAMVRAQWPRTAIIIHDAEITTILLPTAPNRPLVFVPFLYFYCYILYTLKRQSTY